MPQTPTTAALTVPSLASHLQDAPLGRQSRTVTQIQIHLPPFFLGSADYSGSSTNPVGEYAALLPLVHNTTAAAWRISQLGDAAMGGYDLPPTSTLGSHTQRSSAGTLSRTVWMWAPQPHHDALLQVPQVAFLHMMMVMVMVVFVGYAMDVVVAAVVVEKLKS